MSGRNQDRSAIVAGRIGNSEFNNLPYMVGRRAARKKAKNVDANLVPEDIDPATSLVHKSAKN